MHADTDEPGAIEATKCQTAEAETGQVESSETDAPVDVSRFLDSCLRCARPLAVDLMLSPCGHVYHAEPCCTDWLGCVVCDGADYSAAAIEQQAAETVAAAANAPRDHAPDRARQSDEAELHRLYSDEHDDHDADGDALLPSSSAAILRANLGNRRRSARHSRPDPPAPEPAPPPAASAARCAPSTTAAASARRARRSIVNNKESLIKLFFEPQAVLDAIFAGANGASLGSSSQGDACSQGASSAVDEDQLDPALAGSSVALKWELLQRKRRKLSALQQEAQRMQTDLLVYSDAHTAAARQLREVESKRDQSVSDCKRYTSRVKQLHADMYKTDKRVGEAEAELGARIAELVELDRRDQELQRLWLGQEQERRDVDADVAAADLDDNSAITAAAAAAASAAAVAGTDAAGQGGARCSTIPSYLRLAEHGLWRDLLHLEPSLIYAVHARLTAGAPPLAPPSAQTAPTAQPAPHELQLLHLGLGHMPNLFRADTLAEMHKVAKANPHLGAAADGANHGASGGDKGAAPVPAPVPAVDVSDATLDRVRQLGRGLQSDLHRVVFDESAAERAAASAVQSHKIKLRELGRTLRAHQARLHALHLRLEKGRVHIEALEADAARWKQLQEDEQRAAQERGDQQQQQPAAKRARLQPSSSSSSHPAPTSPERSSAGRNGPTSAPSSSSSSCICVDDVESVEGDAESRAMMRAEGWDDAPARAPSLALVSAFPSLYPQSHRSIGGISTGAPSASVVPKAAAASGAAAGAPLRTSFLNAGGSSAVRTLVSAPGRGGKAKLAAAFHLLDCVSSDSPALNSLGLRTANLHAVAAAAAAAPPPPPPAVRANPFGIKSTPAVAPGVLGPSPGGVGARALAHRKKGRELGGDYLVRGHDGRGGSVTIVRTDAEVKRARSAASAAPSLQQKKKAAAGTSSPAATDRHTSPASRPSTSSGGASAPVIAAAAAAADIGHGSPSSSSLFSVPNLAFRPTVHAANVKPMQAQQRRSSPAQAATSAGAASARTATHVASSSDSAAPPAPARTHSAPVGSLVAAFSRAAAALSSTSSAASSRRRPPVAPSAIRTSGSSAAASAGVREVVDLIDDDDDDDDGGAAGGRAMQLARAGSAISEDPKSSNRTGAAGSVVLLPSSKAPPPPQRTPFSVMHTNLMRQ